MESGGWGALHESWLLISRVAYCLLKSWSWILLAQVKRPSSLSPESCRKSREDAIAREVARVEI